MLVEGNTICVNKPKEKFVPCTTTIKSSIQDDKEIYDISELLKYLNPLENEQKELTIAECTFLSGCAINYISLNEFGTRIVDLTSLHQTFSTEVDVISKIEEIEKACVILREAEKISEGDYVFNDYFKLIFKKVDWLTFNKYFKCALFNKDIKMLERYYSFQEKDKIVDFLYNNVELIFILGEVNKQLRKYFLNEVLALKLLQFPGDELWEQLAVKIQTNLPPKKAGNKLEQFENEWWLDNSYEVNGQLLINLEFV